MLREFRSRDTYGQLTKIYNKVKDNGQITIKANSNFYMTREQLPVQFGRFNGFVKKEFMLVQSCVVIEGLPFDEVKSCHYVVHMDNHDRLNEGLPSGMLIDSVYHPGDQGLMTKSISLRVCSSADLLRQANPRYISVSELMYHTATDVLDSVYKMLCHISTT
jgi:hypothetical protein